MRLTPAQCGMHALLGHLLPMGMPRDQSLADRIREGHAFLVRIAHVDFGYDPKAWHEHLRVTNAGGYRWSNKHLGFPRQVASAMANPEWQEAVASLEREGSHEPNILEAAKASEGENMGFIERRYSKEELARRGDTLYENEIRRQLKGADKGKFLAIDIESGAFELDRDEMKAGNKLRARVPEAQIWMVRVGHRAVHRIGGREG